MNFMKYLSRVVILALIFVSCNIEPFEGEVPEQTDNSGGPIASNCSEATQNTAEVALTFQGVSISDSNYGEFCNAYKKALEDQIALCGDQDGTLQILLDALGDCEEQLSVCDVAEEKSANAKQAFENANDQNYSALCSSYKVALQEQISACGTDVNLSAIIQSLGDCSVDNSSGNNDCDNLKMFDTFGLPIPCDYSIYKDLNISKVYLGSETYLVDFNNDGENDHYSKLLYITDGIITLNNENRIVSITDQTYLLEFEIYYKGTSDNQKVIPGLFEIRPSNESYLAGGFFGDEGCDDGLFLCDERNIIFNGVLSISIVEDGIYNVCFDSVIDLFDSRIDDDDFPCFKSSYTGEILPINY
ncbi:hypothetical protein H7U19_10155 [Hyunsoonleella sp. SJ7]|uniref:Lipoprotein n=1 Tax=Hyunsoonleella aquatilis TaxID=2762758 RepID=A0A923KGP0_9FLAO|nr:hypothetical protein [Hyunsoonleella aquatilis]MBC3758766.1 hypothetical protein [Hyunsoonleella aquatilis]